MHTCAVIMAAGSSAAMHSQQPKALLPVAGKPLIGWVRDALLHAGAREQVYIVGPRQDKLRAVLGEQFAYVLQERPRGTGDAVLQASPFLEGRSGTTIVMGADLPLIQAQTLVALQKRFLQKPCAAVVVTAMAEDPSGFGRVLRDAKGRLTAIVEDSKVDAEQKKIHEINAGIYLFDTPMLLSALGQIGDPGLDDPSPLTDALQVLVRSGQRIETHATAFEDIRPVRDRLQLQLAEAGLYRRRALDLMHGGVSILDPDHTYVEQSVQVAPDVTIHSGCHLGGRTVIGEGSVLRSGCDLRNCHVGRNANLKSVQAQDAQIGDDVTIGPYVHLAPGCRIGAGSVVESFVSMRETHVGKGCLIRAHSDLEWTKMGDQVEMGSHCSSFGGAHETKDRVSIGSHARIGAQSCLGAPLRIGEHARVAPGHVVRESVPPYALAREDRRPVVEEDWVLRRRRMQKEL